MFAKLRLIYTSIIFSTEQQTGNNRKNTAVGFTCALIITI